VTVLPFGEGAEVKISPIPRSVMVHARSIVASRIGAAGYKLMRSLARNMELIARPALGTKAYPTKETVMRRRPKPPWQQAPHISRPQFPADWRSAF